MENILVAFLVILIFGYAVLFDGYKTIATGDRPMEKGKRDLKIGAVLLSFCMVIFPLLFYLYGAAGKKEDSKETILMIEKKISNNRVRIMSIPEGTIFLLKWDTVEHLSEIEPEPEPQSLSDLKKM